MAVVTISGAPFANGYVPTISEWNTNIFGALSASINDINYGQVSASLVGALSAGSTSQVANNSNAKGYIDGQIANLQITQESYRIVSGNADIWGTPNFLLSGTSNDFSCVSGLSVYINGTTINLSATQYASGLTLASAGVSATISAAIYGGSAFTRTEGEFGDTEIILDGYASAFTATSRIDTMQAFKTGAEFFLGKVSKKSTAEQISISKCKRGIGTPARATLTDNDVVYLMEANYIFMNSDGSLSATTLPPKYQSSDPAGGTAGEFYFNTSSKVWKRYSGSWGTNNAILLGAVVCDQTGVVAIDHEDFDLSWDSTYEADIYPIMEGTSAISAVSGLSAIGVNIQKVSVAGETVYMPTPRELVLSAQLLSTLTEASGTLYYLYLTPLGEFYFDTVAPRNKGKKRGYYHPKYYWRNIFFVYNDASYNVTQFLYKNGFYDYMENGTGAADSSEVNQGPERTSTATSYALYQFKCMPIFAIKMETMTSNGSGTVIYEKLRFNTYGKNMSSNSTATFQTLIMLQNSTATFYGAGSAPVIMPRRVQGVMF